MMIGGAVVNALAFTGSIVFFKSRDIEKEQKRHDLALELTKARYEWYINIHSRQSLTASERIVKNIDIFE